ncbi:MAG: hypothetical protein KAV82_00760 [Phycisphaerae bacterium]|nr:hypothetical protein [Phycisphaerae bacterium]
MFSVNPRNHVRLIAMGGCLLAALMMVTPAQAEEVTVQNDSATGGATMSIQAGFVAGESAAAWLTSPCDGTIVAVQVFWKSLFGGAADSLEESITIFSAGTFPAPGGVKQNDYPPYANASLLGPVMVDGLLNEFRWMDEEQTLPLSVPVTNGEVFVVSFKFFNTPSSSGPSVCTDTDGCQADKNAIDAQGLGWWDSCALGVTGDFVIRAIIECPGAIGACCDPNGVCSDGVSVDLCQDTGYTFFEGQKCDEVTCPTLTGACCNGSTGGCFDSQTQEACEGFPDGIYAGNGTECDPYPGPCDPGACCLPDGSCQDVIELVCDDLSGTFHEATDCTSYECPQPVGACCLANDSCVDGQTEEACDAWGGEWAGPLTVCFTGICPLCADGDADGDGDVDLIDFVQFQVCFEVTGAGGDPDCKCLDMNNDENVDLSDYALFEEALVGPS